MTPAGQPPRHTVMRHLLSGIRRQLIEIAVTMPLTEDLVSVTCITPLGGTWPLSCALKLA